MKHLFLFLPLSFILLVSTAFGQGLNNLEQYQLPNGLTVILNEDHTKPEVFGYVVCKAGGKDDPANATGIAHYMEHMLFKGTTDLGTTNWEKEKVHIDSIYVLYDLLGQTSDEIQRKEIQKKINEQSVMANEYTIPNEMWNMILGMGGTGINANTSPDRTVFFNSFPPNEIQSWLELYSHRFINPVFRSFQSELEVVYEEKNRKSDVSLALLQEKYLKSFYKNHPYGQQTIIGSTEDLKNPSLTKMTEFFNTWYVPNNMALVLCGDFDTRQVKPMIESTFGIWKSKPVPEKKHWEEKPFNGRELVEVKMSPIKIGILGFRTPPEGDADELPLKICNGILTNESGSGLLDQLTLNNELMGAMIASAPFYDYGMTMTLFIPKIIGQSLDEAEKLVIDKIDKVKKGEFDDWRVDAIKKELYRQYQQSMEENSYRGIQLGEYFASGNSLEKLKTYPERINAITREDIIRVAQKYYGDNYLAFYSTMGSAKNPKIEKPGYKPIVSNTTEKSEFAKKIEAMPSTTYKPNYIDFEKDITTLSVHNGVDLYVTPNPLNDIFSLQIRYKVGQKDIPMLKYASSLMQLAATNEFSKSELKDEFAKIGATYQVSSDESYTTIYLTGIESELNRALYLTNELITSAKFDQKDIKTLLEGEKAERKFEKSEPDVVADALFDWVRYGNKSSYIDRLTQKEIAGLNVDSMANVFRQATLYETELHYAGKLSAQEVKASITNNLKFADNLKKNDVPFVKPVQSYNENTVYLVNKKKALQSKIYFLQNGAPVSIEQTPAIEAFNIYFGGGFSGLVLQEIREYRSLSYSAGAEYRIPARKEAPAYFAGYVGTQADKTREALDVYMDLLRNMPEKKERMKMISGNLELSSITSRPGFRDLSTYVIGLKQKGFTTDPAQLFIDDYKNMPFDQIVKFYNENIKAQPTVISIVGDKKNLDVKKLASFGKLVEIKEKSLYRD